MTVAARSRSRRHWLVSVLLVCAAVAVSQGFARFTYAFVLPAMTTDVLGSYGVAGILGAANLGSYLLGVLAMTAFAHRFEATRLLKWGLAVILAGLVVIATAQAPVFLFVGMLLAGTASAAVWIPAASAISGYAPPERRGLAFGLVTGGIGVAIAISGRLSAQLQSRFGPTSWRPMWGAVAVITAVVLVLAIAFLRPVGEQPEIAPARVAVRRALPGAVALFLSYGLYGVGYAIYTSFLVAALHHDLALSGTAAAGAYSLLGLASIVGGVTLGRLSDRLGRGVVLVGANALVAAATLVVPLRLTAAVVPSVLLFGLLMTGIGTVIVAYLSDALPARDLSSAFGAITLSLGVAQLVAPPVGGWLADATGSFRVPFVVAATACLLAACLAALLPGRRLREALARDRDTGGTGPAAAASVTRRGLDRGRDPDT